uniref:ribonuclease H n=1 Tax=Gongylonema pulchrum TaxID=637853 RepID=A0A183DM42_9BILA
LFQIADYPQPLYKKFDNLDEAKAFYKKYSCDEETSRDEGEVISEAKPVANNNEKEVKEAEKTEQKKEARITIDSCLINSDNEKPAAFYAVARGHQTGVFKTWAECQEATKDFKGAKFKKFDNEEDAQLFAEGKALKEIGTGALPSLCVLLFTELSSESL